MLSEKQIRKDLTKLGRQKRKHIRMRESCKKGSIAWVKHSDKAIILNAQINIVKRLLKGNWIDFKELKTKQEQRSFVLKMKQIKSLVRETLTHDTETRDDDNLLCLRIWEKQGSTPSMTYKAFQAKLISGVFSSPESVGRVRRSLQERYITLRGKLYDKRHQAEEKFKNQYKLDF
jgi:hypothetical protein